MKKSLPPDTRHEPHYQDELTLEVTYSRTKMYRSVISRDANARFRVRREKWAMHDTDRGSWLPDQRGATVAVLLETARSLAEEKLNETPGDLSSQSS